MVEIRSRFKDPSRLGPYPDFWAPPSSELGSPACVDSSESTSSSTPTVPYSTADILYGNEVNGRERQASVSDEPRQNSFGDAERTKEKRQEKDLEAPSNRRPSSKTGKQRSISIDTVTPFDKDWDKEDPLKGLSAALPPAKPSHHFRPNGIRSSSKAEQLLSAKQNGALSGRDQDDLVAMGTLWSPNGGTSQQTLPPNPRSMTTQGQSLQGYKNGTVPNNNTNSFSSKVISSSSSVNNSVVPNNTLNSQRKYSNGMRPPVLLQNNISGKKPSSSQSKEQEDPKYSDPLIGAPASFQQRIIELGALEGDTVRWERSKRLKKKKQDRDS
ncbi:hypothetical protein DPMN_083676 [Dreissena polymorpha]|uniref:Uncharacterized protein n=1 Tax=Dreissena polymorpha TaxID=45954 RepID=A0A9D3YBQ8_DREPO|nr:hypothetical protein DPMN_083676 [Dreissena polymorpha]